MKIGIEFKPQDLWIGIYFKFWNASVFPYAKDNNFIDKYKYYELFVCLLPCLPIHISFEVKKNES